MSDTSAPQRKSNDDDPLNPPPADRRSNPTVNWHKQKRSDETHRSSTDPEARLYKKSSGSEAKLGYLGHVITENRNGLIVDTRLTLATGTAERGAALDMAANKPSSRRITLRTHTIIKHRSSLPEKRSIPWSSRLAKFRGI